MRGMPVVRLHDRDAIPEIPRIAPPGVVGGDAFGGKVKIGTAGFANRAATVLKIAAPGVTRLIEIRAVRVDMPPPVRSAGGGKPLVKAEGALEAPVVGRLPVCPDMPSLAVSSHRGEARLVKLQHLIEAFGVERDPAPHMVGAGRRHGRAAPVHGAMSAGLRMLQPRHSVRLRYVAVSVR